MILGLRAALASTTLVSMIHVRPAFAHLLSRASAVVATVVAAVVLLPSAAHAQPPPAWRWPLPGDPEVVRGFDPPALPWGAGHRGVDLGAYAGEPVYAAGAGRVGYVGRIAGRGIVTVIHGDRRTTYLPVRASVRAGDRVKAGSRIGAVEPGYGHCPARVCLHWGLLRGTTYLDPLSLIPRSPIRLLPFDGPLVGFPLFAGMAGHAAKSPGPAPPSRPVSELARSALAGTGGAGLVLLVLTAAGRGARHRPRRSPASEEGQRATAMHYHPAGGRRSHPGSPASTETPRAPEPVPPEAGPEGARGRAPGVPLLTAIRLAHNGRHRKLCLLRRLLARLMRCRTPKSPAASAGTSHAVVIDLDAERRIRRPHQTDERDPA